MPERAIEKIAQAGPAAGRILDAAAARKQPALDEHAAKTLLAGLGIRVPQGARVAAGGDFGAAVAGLKPPFAVKALSEQPIHKTEIGAVRLNVGPEEIAAACRDIAGRMAAAGTPASGFLVEEMAAPGVEMVIGGTIDPQFGPMIMVGAGGIFAEIVEDVSFRLCPISERDAREMVDELKLAPVLKGARGRQPVAVDEVLAALLLLGGEDGLFTRQAGTIAEFDLNPLIVTPEGVTVVDARIILGEAGR